jgi:hypothetical protein
MLEKLQEAEPYHSRIMQCVVPHAGDLVSDELVPVPVGIGTSQNHERIQVEVVGVVQVVREAVQGMKVSQLGPGMLEQLEREQQIRTEAGGNQMHALTR